MHSIYLITNLINQKVYVGVSSNPVKRWNRHKSNAQRKQNHPLYNSINKHGLENFKFEIILNNLTELQAYQNEKELIIKYDSINKGFNLSSGGIGGGTGIKRTESEKQRLSEIGKNKVFTSEYRKKISEALTGKKHTEESKKKMSDAKKGKLPTNAQPILAINSHTKEQIWFKTLKELSSFLKIGKNTIKKFLTGKTKPRVNGILFNFFNSGWELQCQ